MKPKGTILKNFAFMLALVATIGLASQVQAKRRPRMRMLIALAGKIGVSDAVVEKIKTMHYEMRKKLIPIRANYKMAKLELRRLLDNRDTAESAIIAQVDKVSALKGELKKNRILNRFRIKKLLTPAQVKKLKAFRAHRWGKRGGRGRDKRGHRR